MSRRAGCHGYRIGDDHAGVAAAQPQARRLTQRQAQRVVVKTAREEVARDAVEVIEVAEASLDHGE